MDKPGVSALACTNGVWLPLRPVSVAQNKPSTMLSSNVQPTDLLMNCTDGSGRWDYRMAVQHPPRDLVRTSSGKKNWLKRLRWKKWEVKEAKAEESTRSIRPGLALLVQTRRHTQFLSVDSSHPRITEQLLVRGCAGPGCALLRDVHYYVFYL